MRHFVGAVAVLIAACSYKTDIPLEFPTPEPPPASTPLPKTEIKRDAELEKRFAEIAKDAKGKVGVAAVVLETGEAALLNDNDHYPMQSVYKLPISMAVMEQVRLGKLDLDEKIGVTKEDLVRRGQASPLRDKSPDGGEFTIRELIRLALVESDGTASDVLLRVIGGPQEVQDYLSQIGVTDMKIVNTEKELGQNWDTQYQNWATPLAAIGTLRSLCGGADKNRSADPHSIWSFDCAAALPVDGPEIGWENQTRAKEVLYYLSAAVTGPNRIKGLIPKGTTVAHKTGTGGTRDGITSATNDIGIIYLPNGKHLAIAVFVSDSPADEKTREVVIARIAKAAWDRWNE
jgi:beta-lactamase class A